MFQRFGLADKTSILDFLGDNFKKWAYVEFGLEQQIGEQWYHVPATILGQLVWKVYQKQSLLYEWSISLPSIVVIHVILFFFLSQRSFDDAVKLAIALIDRNSMSLEEYVARCEKGRSSMDQTFKDRAYKMLTIANPNNGDGFFQLIFNYDWSKKGVVALTKEKLYTVATSRVHAERCVGPVLI